MYMLALMAASIQSRSISPKALEASRLAAARLGLANIAIWMAHCKRAYPPLVSTANWEGPTVGFMASLTKSSAQFQATLTIAVPIPVGRWGWR